MRIVYFFPIILVACNILLSSCKTYKINKVDSRETIGVIGGADESTAIYLKSDSDYLINESLNLIQNLCLLAKDTAYIKYSTGNTDVVKLIKDLSSCDYQSHHTVFKIDNLRPFLRKLNDGAANKILIEKLYRSIPMQINSFSGSANLVATSLLACDDVFYYGELKDTCAFVFGYDGYCCMVLYAPKKEGIVQAFATFLIHPMLENIQRAEQLEEFFIEVMDVHGLHVELIE